MSPEVGLLSLTPPDGGEYLGPAGALGISREFSESLAATVDRETRRIVDECYAQARDTLAENRDHLDGLAEALLRHESLDGDEIRRAAGLSLEEVPAGKDEPSSVRGAVGAPVPDATSGERPSPTAQGAA
jgi:cell division protease FtsH